MKPVDVPDAVQFPLPPEEIRRRISNGETLCDGRYTILWASGPMRGRKTSTYCASPGCLTTGYCTGTRFIPHPQQLGEDGLPRKVDPREVVPAAREAAKRAVGRDDPRSDREIKAYAADLYARMMREYHGGW